MTIEMLWPHHYRKLDTGQIVRRVPKLRGKAAVKAAKRARIRARIAKGQS